MGSDREHITKDVNTWNVLSTPAPPRFQEIGSTRMDDTLGRLQLTADRVMDGWRCRPDHDGRPAAAEVIDGLMRVHGPQGDVRVT